MYLKVYTHSADSNIDTVDLIPKTVCSRLDAIREINQIRLEDSASNRA